MTPNVGGKLPAQVAYSSVRQPRGILEKAKGSGAASGPALMSNG
jgi:hypothetical protein